MIITSRTRYRGMLMFIECVKNNNTEYLRLVDARTFSVNGARKHQRYVVRNIGPLSRYDDGLPDYIGRLRESFRSGVPIIPLLNEYVSGAVPQRRIRFELDAGNDEQCFSNPKNIGYFLLDGLYDALGIYDVLNQYKSDKHFPYDLNGLSKLLVFGRTLFPDSKQGTFEERDRYLFNVTSSKSQHEIYHALDGLNDCADAIQKRMNYKIAKGIGRNTEVCFYDVTNYYFEIGENDRDEVGSDGTVIKKGLRKKGVSKEKRGEPIVQMGLFIDDNGIPIAYRLSPGNETDQTTLRPALKKNIANPDKLKDKPRKIERFLEKHTVDKKTGEVIDADTHLSLDMDKIRAYLDLLGYYTIMTSEIDKPDREIINKYHGLSRIEDSFRITKSDLEGRPVFVSTPEHINAHFLTCFIALTMIRIIQHKILKYQGKDTKNLKGWESGLTAERIQTALGRWQADALSAGYYRTNKPSKDLELILTAFGIDGDLRLPTAKDLHALKHSFDKMSVM